MRHLAAPVLAILLAGLSSPALGSIDRAVGWTVLNSSGGGCTCVVIDREGWALTADHCPMPAEFPVKINGRTVQARLVYDPPGTGNANVDHVSLIKLEDGPFAWVEVATAVPQRGDSVHSWGFPNGQKRHWTGVVLGIAPDGDLRVEDPAIGGHSGGPLFNSRNQVVGILSATSAVDTFWMGQPKIRTAMSYMAAGAGDQQPESDGPEVAQPVVWVLTSPGCVPCMNLKTDYGRGKFPGVVMKFVGFDDPAKTLQDGTRLPAGSDLRGRILQATGHYPAAWPTIWAEGASTVTVGYTGFGSLRNWIVGALRLPITFWEGITGDRLQPEPIEIPPRTYEDEPPSSESQLDWADVTIVALGAEQDVGSLRGAGRAIALSRMSGTVERWFSDLTDGRAELSLVFERVTPARYAAVCEAAGVDPALGHFLVLVKQRAHGLRGVARRQVIDLLASRAPEGLQDLPVDVVSQLLDPEAYAAILLARKTEEPEPDPPTDDQPTQDDPPTDDATDQSGEQQSGDTPANDQPHQHQTTAQQATRTELDIPGLPNLTWVDGLWSLLAGPYFRIKRWMEDKARSLRGDLP